MRQAVIFATGNFRPTPNLMFSSATRFSCIAAFGLLGLASCSKSTETAAPANRITFNDFEALDGWTPANPSVTTVQAHSGRYSVKVDQEVEYSLGYSNLLGKASVSKLRKLRIHGWAFLAGPKSTASLVVQIVDPSQNNKIIFWDAVELAKEVKKINEWSEITKEFNLPDNVEAAHQMKIYMWRRDAQQPAYLDDLEILKGE